MTSWFSLSELAAARLPDLPQTRQGLEALARMDGWQENPLYSRKRQGRGGGREYHLALLPRAAQLRLSILSQEISEDTDKNVKRRRKDLWKRYEALPAQNKNRCKARLNALQEVEDLKYAGLTQTAAMRMAAKRAGIAIATLYTWYGQIQGHPREDWLAALAPKTSCSINRIAERAEYHEEAWETFKSDYLRPEQPSLSACYRRVVSAAKEHGWGKIPSERAFRRRLDAEVPRAVQVLAREGRDKAKALYPAQRRTRHHLHAMEAVNMDGHTLDVFARMPNGDIIRPCLIALQDLYSSKFVAWRLSESENREVVRLTIGDMVERYGIPDKITLDNGRAFASKWITGGAPTRYRFKVRDEDPRGLLVALGIDLSWTKPFSGQSKPIERAFRDLTDDIARHPFCAGAYTGNSPDAKPDNYASRAVPFEDLRIHVDRQIQEHNLRTGRKAATCAGRSFEETFETSLADPATIVRWPTSAQRSLWLLASEAFKARKGNGEIHLYGNRFWHPALTAYAGKKVIIRFDPDHLTKPLKIYDLDNSLICEADCVADTGFHDVEAARAHERSRNAWTKAVNQERRAHAALSANQLADIYAKGQQPEASTDQQAPKHPKIPRLVPDTKIRPAAHAKPPAEDLNSEALEYSFSKALQLVRQTSSIDPDTDTGLDEEIEPKRPQYGSRTP
ncbi:MULTISPECIES: transposase domain-containing protein [unclassified Roseibium]|uniref:transposase domain-containing protein n=1 Tax=unclassified Roseibium TaxID=2629323 RepID=UPI00273D968F|nr:MULTISPECIES: transposase domain-containing protein [unclassified Roseibium]